MQMGALLDMYEGGSDEGRDNKIPQGPFSGKMSLLILFLGRFFVFVTASLVSNKKVSHFSLPFV